LAVYKDGRFLNVRFPLPFGVPLRKADIVAAHWFFAAYFTFCHDVSVLFFKNLSRVTGFSDPADDQLA
jgi:hypothetical protein